MNKPGGLEKRGAKRCAIKRGYRDGAVLARGGGLWPLSLGVCVSFLFEFDAEFREVLRGWRGDNCLPLKAAGFGRDRPR